MTLVSGLALPLAGRRRGFRKLRECSLCLGTQKLDPRILAPQYVILHRSRVGEGLCQTQQLGKASWGARECFTQDLQSGASGGWFLV